MRTPSRPDADGVRAAIPAHIGIERTVFFELRQAGIACPSGIVALTAVSIDYLVAPIERVAGFRGRRKARRVSLPESLVTTW